MATSRAPWEFSKAPAPGAPSYPNLPTPAGQALGRELARLCDKAEVEDLKRFPDQGGVLVLVRPSYPNSSSSDLWAVDRYDLRGGWRGTSLHYSEAAARREARNLRRRLRRGSGGRR